MKKANNRITMKLCIILYALALPSTALYCQSSPRTTPANRKVASKTNRAPITIEEEDNEEEEEVTIAQPPKKIRTARKQERSATPTPSTWKTVYNLLPQIFIQSFSAGSDAGIGAFTKTLTKQLMTRHSFLSKKNEALNLIEDLSQKNQVTYLEDTKANLISGLFAAEKLDFEQLEKQTSMPVILGSTASSALIYTISAMTGALIKFGIGISLQLLMPQK